MKRSLILLFLIAMGVVWVGCATTEKQRANDRAALKLVDPSTPQGGQLPEAIRH